MPCPLLWHTGLPPRFPDAVRNLPCRALLCMGLLAGRCERACTAAARALAERFRGKRSESQSRARINRLRRDSRDSLIARLLQLEEERKRQAEREDALREKIFRLHPAVRKRGGDQ